MEIKTPNLIESLKRDAAFPHRISYIKIMETHISWIILTGRIAYKIKKPVKFGKVLDFSKIQLRKKFCEREFTLNKKLCDYMYLDIVKIIKSNNDYRLANLDEKGVALDFAVKMKEIPQELRLDNLLGVNKLNHQTLDQLTQNLVKFHNMTYPNARILQYGRPQMMKAKIKENFQTISKMVKINDTIEEKLNLFVQKNDDLFYLRRNARKIRDIHGDLYLKNIFYSKRKFYMYDRLEFNDSLRNADIAEDVAHLAMDIDYHQREDLQSYFISKYIDKSNDSNLIQIIYFMMCFKACVRAKVSLFRSLQCADIHQKKEHDKEARDHFKLAEKYLAMF